MLIRQWWGRIPQGFREFLTAMAAFISVVAVMIPIVALLARWLAFWFMLLNPFA